MNDNKTELPTRFAKLIGQTIVIDVASRYVYLGTLRGGDATFLELAEADVHDLRDTSTTREEYVLAAGRHGISPNRRRAFVSMSEVVSVSRLEDVIY